MTTTPIQLHATSSGVFAFICGGIEILDPLTSECGRFVYNPATPPPWPANCAPLPVASWSNHLTSEHAS